LSKNIKLAKDHPNNPFLHKYHPDHRIGRDIYRYLYMKIDETDENDPLAGIFNFKGDYEENILGIHKYPIILKGRFLLERVSGVYVINDGKK